MERYDVVMLAVLVLTAMFGAWKGMAWQLASIASLVLSSLVAMRYGESLAPYVSADEPWNHFIAMLVLFLGTSLAVWLVFRLVAGIIDRVRLKEFDRQMGALFGLAKGILLCLVITFFAVTLSESSRQSVLRSRSGYYTALLIQHGTPAMPEKVRNVLGDYIEELDRKLDPDTVSGEGTDRTVDSTEPPSDERPRAWDPDLWREDAREALGEQIDELGRQFDRSGEEIHSAMSQQIDGLGNQIERLPLKPVSEGD